MPEARHARLAIRGAAGRGWRRVSGARGGAVRGACAGRRAPARARAPRRDGRLALARADRLEVELFAERRWENAGVGMALIRDGNGTRSFETLMRYRGAAMAEFWRALRTLKALQAEARADAAAAAEVPELPVAPPALVDARRPTRSAPEDRPSAADRTNPSAGPRSPPEHRSRVRPARPIRARPTRSTSPPRPGCRTNPTATGSAGACANGRAEIARDIRAAAPATGILSMPASSRS